MSHKLTFFHALAFRSFVLIFILAALVSGCAPRGETKSLDEVLQLAKDRYAEVAAKAPEGAVRGSLDALTQELDRLVASKGAAATQARQISMLLSGLTDKAGFTARPGLTELSQQYRRIASSGDVPANEGSRVKLLVARTYNLVASELESTKFSVS